MESHESSIPPIAVVTKRRVTPSPSVSASARDFGVNIPLAMVCFTLWDHLSSPMPPSFAPDVDEAISSRFTSAR